MTGATTSGQLRQHNLLRMLRAIHDRGAGATRSDLTHELGWARGTAAVLVNDLVEAHLIQEIPSPRPTRGRPTAIPGPHPEGPLALAVDLREDSWTIAAAELGGRITVREEQPHSGTPDVLKTLSAAVQRHSGPRVVGVAVAAPGPIRDGGLLDIPNLGWREMDTAQTLPGTRVFNDSVLAALAEGRRGALRGTRIGLHLHIAVDLGGALVLKGSPVSGARGTTGEFGHMPLTSSRTPCTCGAIGCWGPEVGRGRPVRESARALGTGIGALVNALDPEVVTLSGRGVDLHAQAAGTIHAAYLEGLMAFRRARPPEIVPSALGPAASLIGAAELVFDAFLTPEGLASWRP